MMKWLDRDFDSKVCEIPEIVLAEAMLRIRPLVRKDGKLYAIQEVHPRNVAFTWEPKIINEPITAVEITTSCTSHGCGYHGFFRPSISEVLAQIPNNLDVNAFWIDTDTASCYACGGGHEATTHWVKADFSTLDQGLEEEKAEQNAEEAVEVALNNRLSVMTKRQIKAAYQKAEFGLSDAIPALMDRFDMDRGEAITYLGNLV